jgi:hypothetical protein
VAVLQSWLQEGGPSAIIHGGSGVTAFIGVPVFEAGAHVEVDGE